MAPIGESCYFPPLDRCLSGDHQLISWKAAFTGLSQLDDQPVDSSLRRHLTDSYTFDLLVRSFSPFSPPTPQTKSSFETKTSAINVPPSNDGRYDVKELKDDTIWLSKETSINELAALRIVMLEWQMRSCVQLLQENTADELAQIHTTGRGGGLQTTVPSPRSSVLAKSSRLEEGDPGAFDSLQSRQKRLLKVYLSERRYIIKTSEYLISRAQCQATHQERKRPKDKAVANLDWVQEIGDAILADWKADDVSSKDGKNHIVSAVDALQTRATDLEQGTGWFKDQDLQEDMEAAWANNQILEMIHIMEIILVLLDSSTKLTSSDAFLAWFRFMNRYAFFEVFEPPFRALHDTYDLPLQSLVALVSLAIFRLPSALTLLSEISAAGTAAPESTDNAPYILNPAVISEVQDTLTAAADACPITASPAVLAWGIILQTLRGYALQIKEKREIRQSDRASERFSVVESDNEGPEQSYRSRSSTSSDTSPQLSFLEELLERVMLTALDVDPIAYLAERAVDVNGVFNILTALAVDYCTPFGSEHHGQSGLRMRRVLLELIQAVLGLVDYQPALLIAALAVLTGSERYWDVLERPIELGDAEPASTFLKDDRLMQRLFGTALSRFPYETLPFLKLCRALAVCNANDDEGLPAIWPLIDEVEEITVMLPAGFVGYKTIREDEEVNYVELIDSLSFIGPDPATSRPSKRLRASMACAVPSDALELPSGTVGRILSETRPPVVMWHYEYSGVAYMGKVLQLSLAASDISDDYSNTTLSREVVAEIIDLMSVMISTTVKSTLAKQGSLTVHEAARKILEKASDGLDRNQDVISVVFEIFENELQRHRTVSEEDGSVDILVRCIQFTHALLPVMPDRVWPFLGRSSLLGISGGESKISAVIASTEMVTGRYEFLLGCIRIFDALVEDAVGHAVARKTPAKIITRFSSHLMLSSGISQTAMKKVLLSLQRIMVDVFESTKNWRFAAPEERLEINAFICTVFSKILRYSFAVDDDLNISNKLVEPLAPAAEYVVDVFLSTSNNDLSIHPLLEIFSDGMSTSDTSLSTRSLQSWTSQVRAAVTLTTTLIEVNRLFQNPPSHLEEQVFKASPILARVYAAHGDFKSPVANLFHALICCAATKDNQPPSLLGHLGQETASHFLEVLSSIDQPVGNEHLSVEVWRLLSAMVSKRQQWLAIFVLTGNTPRDSLKNPKATDGATSRRSRSILKIALDSLSNIGKLQPRRAIAMLEFVSLAADAWPWVLVTMEQHPHFLTAMVDYIGGLEPSPGSTKDRVTEYSTTQIYSSILDIFAMYVHHTRQTGDPSFAKKLTPKISYFIRNAVSTPSYNASLQGNLRQNFESQFPTCSLLNLKRTSLERPLLGDSFFYDLDLANKMFSFSPAWAGRRNQGFAEELVRANLNLSLVESQVNLLHSWKFLAIELSRSLETEAKFQKSMAMVVINCLESNVDMSLPGAISERLSQARMELAFTLLQRLIEVKAPAAEVSNILPKAWDTVRLYSTDVGSSIDGEGAEYYRTLLKILLLALRAHTTDTSPRGLGSLQSSGSEGRSVQSAASALPETLKIVLEILGAIVARGFRSLTTALHDNTSRVLPADFALITAILRTLLSVPGIDRHTTQLIAQFSEHQTARCASALLSWSDQLATNGDPIFGELSILFLLELSSIPALAESLAVEGLLAHISNTNLVQKLRQARGMGPFDTPVRMFSIWSRGILPLYLNLLHAVGASIAVEISTALNSFPGQLARASSYFDGKGPSPTDPAAGFITLSMVSEAQTLAVITTVLDTFREAGASAGIIATDISEPKWDRAQIKEDIENWMQRRASLRDKIVPASEKEEAWARQGPLQPGSGALNRLEEKVVGELNGVLMLLSGGG